MSETTGNRMNSMHVTNKPFNIDKRLVYEAYKAVKSNGGAAGVDGQTIEQFEADLKSSLYKIWNRMSSGTYFPPPVRAVSIPKKSGGQRILGVPTVADRVAQMVVKQVIEPILDPVFLADSYGYRPRKSALDAVGVTRERCWRYDRVDPLVPPSTWKCARRTALSGSGAAIGAASQDSGSLDRPVWRERWCRT